MRSSLDILSISNSAVEVHEIFKCPFMGSLDYCLFIISLAFIVHAIYFKKQTNQKSIDKYSPILTSEVSKIGRVYKVARER